MTKQSDQEYLLQEQYRDATNLRARQDIHARFSTNPYDWFQWVFDNIDLPENAQLLELGCGTGTLWTKNLPRIPTGWQITLSDFSPGMLEEARHNLADKGSYFLFKCIDAQNIPLENQSFDAVIANHMLYHVPDREKSLKEISRIIKPGGYLFAATNGSGHLKEIDELINQITPGLGVQIEMTFGSSGFTLENGKEQLTPWFSDVKMRPYEDGLVVTQAAPLVAYLLSMTVQEQLQFNRDKIAAYNKIIEDRLASESAIRITKSTGLFIAQKGDQPILSNFPPD